MSSGFLSDDQKKYLDSIPNQSVDFIMGIQDVFTMPQGATVVTGIVAIGSVRLKDIVEVITRDGSRFYVKVTGIEKDRKLLETATKGDQIGILLPLRHSGIVSVGDVLFRIDK